MLYIGDTPIFTFSALDLSVMYIALAGATVGILNGIFG